MSSLVSSSYPNKALHFITGAVLLGIIALFISSFYSIFTGVTLVKDPRKQQPSSAEEAVTSDAMRMGFDFSSQTSDSLSKLMAKLKAEPENVDLLIEISETFLDTQNYAQAEGFLTRAILLRPRDITARALLGKSQYLQDNNNEAAKTFEEILAIEPNASAMINLAIIYKYYLHREDAAKELFQQVLTLPGAEKEFMSKAKEELRQ